MMSTIDGGHYQPQIPSVRAASADGYHEGELGFEEVETAEGGELVEHEQKAALAAGVVQFFRQAAADLVQDQPDQRFRARNVRGRHHEVERDRPHI